MFEIGNSLREARLRQEADFPEIEQATKIRVKYLRALEAEQFELLPAQTYVKGFLRSYAEYLGLDGQLYVDEYNTRYIAAEEETQFRSSRTTAASSIHRRIESNVMIGALIGIAIVTALVIGAWQISGDSNTTSRNTAPEADRQSKAPLRAVPPARSRSGAARIIIKAARGSCWLEVRRNTAGGKQLFQGTLEAGRSLPFVARRIVVTAGAPENLTVRVNGRARRVPSRISPAQLTIDARRISASPLPG